MKIVTLAVVGFILSGTAKVWSKEPVKVEVFPDEEALGEFLKVQSYCVDGSNLDA